MGSLQPGGKRRLGEGGSFTCCHPVAAPRMRRDCSPGRCRNKKAFQDAQQQSQAQRHAWGSVEVGAGQAVERQSSFHCLRK